jgi:hypothetical protein
MPEKEDEKPIIKALISSTDVGGERKKRKKR